MSAGSARLTSLIAVILAVLLIRPTPLILATIVKVTGTPMYKSSITHKPLRGLYSPAAERVLLIYISLESNKSLTRTPVALLGP
ncbi:hypothetical protein MBCUR_07880 [Methanobrevibacter curvatus]|uniref:Uncharacterized protein n=1 Tax=Methanobrevibacter curvatus TaxID=49547 RepID=A0A166B771_9EURY|nr:hypothetical protein MBCUR_07880 [Methanobrevibacter curvatus]